MPLKAAFFIEEKFQKFTFENFDEIKNRDVLANLLILELVSKINN